MKPLPITDPKIGDRVFYAPRGMTVFEFRISAIEKHGIEIQPGMTADDVSVTTRYCLKREKNHKELAVYGPRRKFIRHWTSRWDKLFKDFESAVIDAGGGQLYK